MTPTIIEKNGKLWMVLGSPGGPAIVTSVLQVFLNVSVFGMNIDQAVQSPRYHHQGLPDEIMVEKNGFSKTLTDTLSSIGHKIRLVEKLGLVEAILLDENGVPHGAADYREDLPSGW
jgi:gamma-glutamyltranspeptidase/glutathione hydrolase